MPTIYCSHPPRQGRRSRHWFVETTAADSRGAARRVEGFAPASPAPVAGVPANRVACIVRYWLAVAQCVPGPGRSERQGDGIGGWRPSGRAGAARPQDFSDVDVFSALPSLPLLNTQRGAQRWAAAPPTNGRRGKCKRQPAWPRRRHHHFLTFAPPSLGPGPAVRSAMGAPLPRTAPHVLVCSTIRTETYSYDLISLVHGLGAYSALVDSISLLALETPSTPNPASRNKHRQTAFPPSPPSRKPETARLWGHRSTRRRPFESTDAKVASAPGRRHAGSAGRLFRRIHPHPPPRDEAEGTRAQPREKCDEKRASNSEKDGPGAVRLFPRLESRSEGARASCSHSAGSGCVLGDDMICCITLTGRSTTDGVGHEFLVSNVRAFDLFSSSCHGHRNEIMWSNKHTFKLRRTSSVPAALGVSRDTIPPPCTRALPRGRVGSGRIRRSRCTDGPAQTTRHRLTGLLGLCAMHPRRASSVDPDIVLSVSGPPDVDAAGPWWGSLAHTGCGKAPPKSPNPSCRCTSVILMDLHQYSNLTSAPAATHHRYRRPAKFAVASARVRATRPRHAVTCSGADDDTRPGSMSESRRNCTLDNSVLTAPQRQIMLPTRPASTRTIFAAVSRRHVTSSRGYNSTPAPRTP
ncbi:hypothetical protein ACCO45_001382 [Purpureocillium lilacinum]|uniref:Uncharacterized protein n=1 Tax=Purpureocillium lilacinum TaxID=33203 RepID=A0ACC4E7S2_PURLI